MSIIVSATVPERLRPGIHHFYGLDYTQKEKVYSKFMSTLSSTKAFEQVVALAATGIMSVKNESTGFVADNMTSGQAAQFVHAAFGKVLTFSHEAIEDDQYAPKLAEKIGSSFAKSQLHTEEIFAHNVLNNGFSTVTAGMYRNPDGKALFATDHPLLKGGTISNTLSSAIDLSELGIENLVTQIRNYTDHAGIRIGVSPQKILVSTADEFNLKRIMQSPLQVDSANHNYNAVGALGLEMIVSPYLTDTDAWFISTSENKGDNGLVMFKREEIKMASDMDVMTMNSRFTAYSRFSVGYVSPLAIAGSAGA